RVAAGTIDLVCAAAKPFHRSAESREFGTAAMREWGARVLEPGVGLWLGSAPAERGAFMNFMPSEPQSHLRRLEAEAIFIMREVVATFERPVMLYSIGKDSSVMLHLARKAFYPAPLPFPLLHIDTTWKFKEMIRFRDETAKRFKLDLRVYTNQDGVARGVNP